MEKRFIKLNEVIHTTGLSRASIYLMIQRGQFPRQLNISERSVAWVSTEVQGWIADKIDASRQRSVHDSLDI